MNYYSEWNPFAAQVEICRLLASRGPLTLRQLTELRGRPECSTRQVLGVLVRHGLVRKLSGSQGAVRYEVCVPVSME